LLMISKLIGFNMVNTNFSSNSHFQFTQELNKLSDSRYAILASDDALILEKKTSSDVSKVPLKKIEQYLGTHQSQLESSDVKILRKLEQRILKDLGEETKRLKVSEMFDSLITNINTKPHSPSEQKINQSVPIVLRISPPPKNIQEFKQNLKLFLSQVPRYQLGHSLEIYDTNSFQLPAHWDPLVVVQSLHKSIEELTAKIGDADAQPSAIEQAELRELYQEAVKLLTPKTLVSLGVIYETTPFGIDNSALYLDAEEFIKAQKPLVANRHLFNLHKELFISLKKVCSFDLYLQKEGGLCVVLPKGVNPEAHGFKIGGLQKWEHDHLNLPETALDFAENSRALFKEDTSDRQFLRLIIFAGHGMYPQKTYNKEHAGEGVLAGFRPSELQKVMQVCKENHMVFCGISSCYSGGANAVNIHLPDQTISCPIIVLSSLETSSHSYIYQNEFIPLLDRVQKQLFPAREKKALFPKHLTKKNLKAIAEHYQANLRIFNLPSIFLPKNRANIPTTVSALIKDSSLILDVSYAAKKTSEKRLIDEDLNRKALFFSDPIVPLSLTCPGSMPLALLSRGSNAIHVMPELNLPEKDIEAIGAATFNLSDYQTSELNLDSPAKKTFFIKTMQCRLGGKKTTLQHVMFKKTADSCQMLFQVEGETGFRRLDFVKTKERWDPPLSFETISLQKGHVQIYQAIHQTHPSDQALEMTTGGKLTRQELLEGFNEIFWGSPLPLDIQLESALQFNPSIFEKDGATGKVNQSTKLEKVLEDLKEQLTQSKGTPKEEELLSLLRDVSDHASDIGKSEEADQIKQLTFTPLMHAVVSGSLEKVKEVLDRDPSMIDAPQLNGSTPLLLACDYGYVEIAHFLLEKGANPTFENRFQKTPFAFASERGLIELMKLMLTHPHLNIKGKIGIKALSGAFHSNQEKVATFLLQMRAGEEEDVSDLLFIATFKEKCVEFLEQLLTYPKRNLNQIFLSRMVTPLVVCVQKKDLKAVELLLDYGALVDVLDLYGYSPLAHAVVFGEEQSFPIVELLLKKGASLNSLTKEGNSLLHYAVGKGNIAVIDLLLTRGSSWTLINKKGQTPLEVAFQKDPKLLTEIAKHPSFNIDLPDAIGATPLSRAISQGNFALAKALINLGANINQEQGGKPLILSLLSQEKKKISPEVMEFFLAQKVSLNSQDEQGNTVLHYAQLIPVDCLKQIVTSSPNLLHIKNKNGETPLMFLAKQMFSNPEDSFLYQTAFEPLIEHDQQILEQDIEGILAYLLDASFSFLNPAYNLVKKGFFSLGEEKRNSPAYALHKAILEDQPEILELMKKPTSTLLFGLSESMSLIHRKIFFDSGAIMTLIEAGGDIQTKAPSGSTLLHYAAKKNNSQLVELLIHKKIDPTVLNKEGKTAFDLYYQRLSPGLMRDIVENGWDLTGQLGFDLLQCILRRSSLSNEDQEIFNYLIQNKAGSKIDRSPLLSQAIKEKNLKAIDIFLQDPLIDLNVIYKERTPLSFALEKGIVDIVQQLLAKKADPNLTSRFVFPERKETPLQQILLSTGIEREKAFQMADLLLKYGADMGCLDEHKNSMFHLAVINDDLALVTYLLSKGIRTDLKNEENSTPLELAAKMHKGELFDLLKKAETPKEGPREL
jgi:ankyrin repeat protein